MIRLGCAWVVLLASSCVKEITSDERLERETGTQPHPLAPGAAELHNLRCDDTASRLAQARNEDVSETVRVSAYTGLYASLRDRSLRFDQALSRNPDLAYRDGSQERMAARDQCVQQTADVRLEFERYVRELVEMPTVQEIKGGATITVARLDFATLKKAIETLGADDREGLLKRIGAAEKKVEAARSRR